MVRLEEKIRKKSARIGVVGLGYVGLPLALAFAEAGFRVLGFDIQQLKVDLVNQGKSYIVDVSDERVSAMLHTSRFEATGDQNRLSEVDVVCICVPTDLTRTKDPDLSYVTHESQEISNRLRPGQLVILESTTYPSTTRGLVLPILERSGLKAGSDFYLAFSPERIDPGNKNYSIKNTTKIVGGIDARSTKLTELLYRQVTSDVFPVSSPEVAEMTKVFENVFRNVNIALVNELAQLCERMHISVWEVIDAASTKPFGYMPFYPGTGIGGHCIPLDPYYLCDKAREYDFHTRFIELATEINERMPYYVISRIMEALNTKGKSLKGGKVLVLGAAYKKNLPESEESPSLKLIELLQEKGAHVSYHDPYIPKIRLSQNTLYSVELTKECLASADCIVIATSHDCYDLEEIADQSKLLFDARGATKGLRHNNIIRLGE
jgi:UDP-N-acetyl-D-glucosamine dehydrogenase